MQLYLSEFFGCRVLSKTFLLLGIGISATSIASSYPFRVEKQSQDNSRLVYAVNEGFAPVYVRVELADANNITSDRQWPFTAMVSPRSKQRLAIVQPANPASPSSWSYQYNFSLGDIAAVPNQEAIYRIPFDEGTRFVIGQGYQDPRTTHTSPESLFAVDFTIPQGTPVLASRDGVVIDVEMTNVYGGQETALHTSTPSPLGSTLVSGSMQDSTSPFPVTPAIPAAPIYISSLLGTPRAERAPCP